MSTRRRNKSHKVPNVKLRPADAGATTAAKARLAQNAVSTAWAQDSDGDELDGNDSVLDLCPRPFKGLIICATGISDKTTLFKQAVELGALPLPDLTDRVTHLIAEEAGSAKYKCALERKIPIMHPSWIQSCHQTWLHGDDVDLPASIASHRLPIFSGIVLCVSGIEDVPTRTKIHKLVMTQGGMYAKALERPIRVTHLLCSGDAETEKMRYAEKFNNAGEARIHLVWEEWFWDSLDFGGRFDEATYAVTRPRPERKTAPAEASAMLPQPSSAPLSSSPIAVSTVLNGGIALGGPVTPAHAAGASVAEDEEEVVSVRRPAAETLQVWESLLRPRGFAVVGGRLARSPSKAGSSSEPAVAGAASPCPPPRPLRSATMLAGLGAGVGPRASALAGFSRAHSFAPESKDASTPKGQTLFRRVASRPRDSAAAEISSFLGGMQERDVAHALSGAESEQADAISPAVERASDQRNASAGPSRPRAAFAGLKFTALGEARSEPVRAAVEGAGGKMLEDDDEAHADFILVRLVSGSALYRAETDATKRAKFRTECWLERCTFEERLCEPEEHASFVPLTFPVPLPGAEQVVLSFSGLDQSELLWARRLGRALGVTLAESFSRRTTHLICPAGEGAKFNKAQEWRVPVVGNEWMAEMARIGVVPPARNCLVGPGGARIEPPQEPSVSVSVDVEALYTRGKGKEPQRLGVADITNGSRSRGPSQNEPIKQTMSMSRHDSAENDTAPEDEPFGMPNGLLGLSSSPASHAPDSDALHGAPEPLTPPPPSSSNAGSVFGAGPAASPPRAFGGMWDRSSSMEEQAQAETRPSSPSPDPATRALQQSITHLLVLGKRATESDLDDRSRRPGKRARPLAKTRSKDSPFALDRDPTRLSPPSFAPFEGLNSSVVGRDAGATGACVTHEDPAQREEQRRLMSLLGRPPPDGESGGSKRKLVRRARQPGF